MKDGQKASPVSADDYVDPNLNWECGRRCEGSPCRIGPSPRGKCRATYECEPRLEVVAGETKGHWACTRPRSAGGKCENGPWPDGTCCNPIPKCQPRRTLRSVRKRVSFFAIVASCLILFIGLDGRLRDRFINPGPVTGVHSSEHFAGMREAPSGDAGNCAACHGSARRGGDPWGSKVFDAFRNGLAPANLIKAGPIGACPMDINCLACHGGKDFHQPNMAGEFACHTCHAEHKGSEPVSVNSSLCTACHGSAALMAESQALGRELDPHGFSSSLKLHSRARPAEGFTAVINAFHIDHPEFQLIRDEVRDPNSLKFNHKFHLDPANFPAGPPVCTDCHETDGRGEYVQPITYERHCAECHPMQFDEDTELRLPHGDPLYVRASLRSTPIQYAELGRAKGIPENGINDYVRERETRLREQYESGEELERKVFFADFTRRMDDGSLAKYRGCAGCHEVTDRGRAAPAIEEVSIPDRWMSLGRFNHEMHQEVDCAACHRDAKEGREVKASEKTSDLLLPSIQICVDCHNPRTGIDNSCTRCHTYHNSRPGLPFLK